ncbi:MAG: DNA repair protein RadC [Lutibacter sp.]|nr:DNA repair protein RadC [Lutibacter sp.]MBP9600255.1 DNA repair protein RadC [Lutibacter sp.]
MKYETTNMPITSWAEDDRPREKLISKGKFALTDAELVAILIGSGSREETAVGLSQKILASVKNNLNGLSKLSIIDLQKFKGIGEAKAISIITALELGRRRRLEEAMELPIITSSKAVFEIMQPLIGELAHEEFWIVFLNNSNKVLNKLQLSIGGLTGTLVDPRLVFKKAIDCNATAIILCHNHPSGKLTPSEADKQITKKLVAGGLTLDIKVLDHLIITENAYFSFADENIL